MTPLAGWESFYAVVGPSAGALIGLQFIVITLIADAPQRPGTAEVNRAFSTPTIVHLGTVLLLAAILCAPWGGIAPAAILWGLTGLGGIAYGIVVAGRARSQTIYQPDFEDWLFHVLFPLVAYAMLAASSLATLAYAPSALFVVGAAALLLLFIGIHNAWDNITYHVFVRRPREREESMAREASRKS